LPSLGCRPPPTPCGKLVGSQWLQACCQQAFNTCLLPAGSTAYKSTLKAPAAASAKPAAGASGPQPAASQAATTAAATATATAAGRHSQPHSKAVPKPPVVHGSHAAAQPKAALAATSAAPGANVAMPPPPRRRPPHCDAEAPGSAGGGISNGVCAGDAAAAAKPACTPEPAAPGGRPAVSAAAAASGGGGGGGDGGGGASHINAGQAALAAARQPHAAHSKPAASSAGVTGGQLDVRMGSAADEGTEGEAVTVQAPLLRRVLISDERQPCPQMPRSWHRLPHHNAGPAGPCRHGWRERGRACRGGGGASRGRHARRARLHKQSPGGGP